MPKTAIYLLCSVFLMCCASADKPLHPTVCEVVVNPQHFSGQTVMISATWDVTYHFTLLKDQHCANVGISLQISEEAQTRKDIKEFMDLAYGKPDAGTPNKQELGRFTGRIQLQNDPGEIPYLALDLQSFSRF